MSVIYAAFETIVANIGRNLPVEPKTTESGTTMAVPMVITSTDESQYAFVLLSRLIMFLISVRIIISITKNRADVPSLIS